MEETGGRLTGGGVDVEVAELTMLTGTGAVGKLGRVVGRLVTTFMLPFPLEMTC